MGAASGVVSALVAITPACGAVSPIGTLLIGFFATEAAPNGKAGLFCGGGLELLGIDLTAHAESAYLSPTTAASTGAAVVLPLYAVTVTAVT